MSAHPGTVARRGNINLRRGGVLGMATGSELRSVAIAVAVAVALKTRELAGQVGVPWGWDQVGDVGTGRRMY